MPRAMTICRSFWRRLMRWSAIILLTGRPCLQFAVDIEAYRQDRNFYFSLDQMPFPLAQDNDALERAVLEWREEEAAQAWKGFCETFGIREDGKASARCADWILEKINTKT